MKSLFILLFSLIASSSIKAQQTSTIKKHSIFFSTGQSNAGSGDVAGFYFRLGIERKVKRLAFSIAQQTTIHDGIHSLLYEYPQGNMNDASMRYSVTGIELLPMVGYSIISTSNHDLRISLGSSVRYQSNGDNDMYGIYYPAATGFPIPVVVFNNRTPLRTFAIGPIGQLSYDIKVCDRWLAGVNGSFQFDTNGDTFLNFGLRAIYSLKK